MADCYQTGVITTLHRLGETRLDKLEAGLCEYAETRPLTLVIPALASEMEGAVLTAGALASREGVRHSDDGG